MYEYTYIKTYRHTYILYISSSILLFILLTYIFYISCIIYFDFKFLGHRVTVRFGCEIIFDDLIEEHERTYGKLWKYKSNNRVSNYNSDNSKNVESTTICSNNNHDDDDDSDDDVVVVDDDNDHQNWISRPNDYILYSKITLRIEEALIKLIKQHQNER